MLALLSAFLVTFCFFIISSIYTTPVLNNQEGTFSTPAIFKRVVTVNLRDDIVSGSLNATAEVSDANDDYSYICPITIGGQTLNLDFDTGSADFWVLSVLLEDQDPHHNYYDPNKSTTYKSTEFKFNVEYEDNESASGPVGIETMSIFGAQVTGQYFGLASEIDGNFVGDGVVGLAFDNINSKQPTFFDILRTYLKAALFAAYIPWKRNGFFDFGAIVNGRYTNPILYTPVNSAAGFWEFNSQSYKVGETVYTSPGQTGFPDTGTSFIYMQQAQVQKYYDSVESAYIVNGTRWAFPCNATLPDLSFAVGDGGGYATIIGGGDGGLLNMGDLPDDDENCLGTLQVSTIPKNTYGLAFFAEYYLIFDASDPKNPRLGFADLV